MFCSLIEIAVIPYQYAINCIENHFYCEENIFRLLCRCYAVYRLETVNSNTVNSKFHLIRSYYKIFFYHFPNIPCLKYTVNSNFHLIQSKTLPMNDFKLTIPDLFIQEYPQYICLTSLTHPKPKEKMTFPTKFPKRHNLNCSLPA